MASPKAILASLEQLDRGMRFEAVGKLGRIRKRRRNSGEVSFWIDLRPYGRVWSHRGIPLRDRRTAERVLEQIRGKVAEGRALEDVIAHYLPLDAKPNLVPHWLARWLEIKRHEVRSGDRSPTYLRELERYASKDGHFSFFKSVSVFEIDFGALEDWSLWLADRDLSPKTRRNVLGAFHAFLNWLRRRDVLRRVPEFPWPRVHEREPQILSIDAQEAVLDTIPLDARGIFVALATMGLRPGEARALDLSDYREGWLTVDKAMKGPAVNAPIGGTKTGKGKRLPVPEPLAEWIDEHVDPRARLHGRPLFLNPNTGQRWGYYALRETWMRACAKVGVRITLYEGTKHTFASDAIRRGVPERSLQTYLGHQDVRSTRRYARLSEQALVEVLRKPLVAHLSPAKSAPRKSLKSLRNLASPAGFEPALPA